MPKAVVLGGRTERSGEIEGPVVGVASKEGLVSAVLVEGLTNGELESTDGLASIELLPFGTTLTPVDGEILTEGFAVAGPLSSGVGDSPTEILAPGELSPGLKSTEGVAFAEPLTSIEGVSSADVLASAVAVTSAEKLPLADGFNSVEILPSTEGLIFIDAPAPADGPASADTLTSADGLTSAETLESAIELATAELLASIDGLSSADMLPPAD